MGILLILVLLGLIATCVVVITAANKPKRPFPPGHFPPPGQFPPGQYPPGQFPQQQFPQQQFPPQAFPQQQFPPQQFPQQPFPQQQFPPQPGPQQQFPPSGPLPLAPAGGQTPAGPFMTAANGYTLALPQFGPQDRAIITVALVSAGKVFFRAKRSDNGVFGGGLDLLSDYRQPHEDVLQTVRRIVAQETGLTQVAPLASIGHAQWDLGRGQENDIAYAVVVPAGPDGGPPRLTAAADTLDTWAGRHDLDPFRDLGPRAVMACQFATSALDAAGM